MSYHTCRILTEYFSWQDSLRSLPVNKENLFAGTIISTGLQGHYSYQLTEQRWRSPRRVGPQAWSLVTLDKITLHPVYQITWPRLKLLWNKTSKLWCNLLSGVTGCHQTVSSAPLLRPLSVLATGRLSGQARTSGPAHWQTVTRENLMMIPFRYLHCYMFVLFAR